MVNAPDPFEQSTQVNNLSSDAQGAPPSSQTHYPAANGGPPHQGLPTTHPHTDPGTDINSYPAFAAAYGAATQPYGLPNYPYAPAFGQYGTTPYAQTVGASYSQAYPGYSYSSYGRPFASTPARLHATNTTTAEGTINNAGVHQTGSQVLNNLHDAMARFARVSAHIDEVLRHLHMLFDAVFGLGYSLGAMREEARLWLANKTGPVAIVCRILRAFTSVWRILSLFFLSPMAGRYSPVATVLRILGLVPDHLNYYHNSSENDTLPQTRIDDQQLSDQLTYQSHAPDDTDPQRPAEPYRFEGAESRDFSNM